MFVADCFILASRDYLTGWRRGGGCFSIGRPTTTRGRQAGSPVLRGHPHVQHDKYALKTSNRARRLPVKASETRGESLKKFKLSKINRVIE